MLRSGWAAWKRNQGDYCADSTAENAGSFLPLCAGSGPAQGMRTFLAPGKGPVRLSGEERSLSLSSPGVG